MTQCGLVYSSSKRTEVMMIADSLEFGRFPVQEETLFRDIFKFADTETGVIAINNLTVFLNLRSGGIKTWIFGTP